MLLGESKQQVVIEHWWHMWNVSVHQGQQFDVLVVDHSIDLDFPLSRGPGSWRCRTSPAADTSSAPILNLSIELLPVNPKSFISANWPILSKIITDTNSPRVGFASNTDARRDVQASLVDHD